MAALRHMPGALLVAIVAPITLAAGMAGIVALAGAALVAGVALVALLRAVLH